MTQISLRILLTGIETHSGEEVNIPSITLGLSSTMSSLNSIEDPLGLKLKLETHSTVKNSMSPNVIALLAQIKLLELTLLMVTQIRLIQTPSMMALISKEELDTANPAKLETPMIAIQTLSAHTTLCMVPSIIQEFSRASNKKPDTTINICQGISRTSLSGRMPK